ncbi:alanine racemase [Anaerosinus massiliensis]|uniref:alanine racemase n=1 Tax=Massilibacillus massiliensis TaxID=1806837 RepID=UPI000B0C05E4|nr:alanine racemase [Massilibacillus massiliensis]
MPNRAVWAQVDLAAIAHNMKEIKSKVQGNAKICAVVKANAYGHGVVAVAKTAIETGADYLAVAILNEALELRHAGFLEPILILGFTPAEHADQLVRHDIEQAVFTLEMAEALSKAAANQQKTAKVHLKIDTGMRRIGIRPDQAGAFAEKIQSMPNLEIVGMFSHFATADSEDKAFAQTQLARFKTAIAQVESKKIHIPIKHIANSAAILEMPEAHFDMVRAGIILYGLWPSDEVKHSIDLKPAMQLKAKVAYVKTMPSDCGISYGQIFRTQRESKIATLPIGYADGWTRLLTGKVRVEIHNKLVPIVGKICMDQCMADVTEIADVQIGDEVILFGSEQVSIDDIANLLGTIHYEIVCMVGKRVPRVYKK